MRYNRRSHLVLAILVSAGCQSVQAAEEPSPAELRRGLAEAMLRQDERAVQDIASRAIKALGETAGMPEVADTFRPLPAGKVMPLSNDERRAAFEPYLKLIRQRKWWKIGLDPTKTPHLPREVASVVTGCLAAHEAGCQSPEDLIAEARAGGDFLLWMQQQGGTGGIPFPAVRGVKGNKALEVGDRFLKAAEQQGILDKITRNGWVIDDLADGGLQFDNGICGVALFELYRVTKDDRYLRGAIAAADWAIGRPIVPNWNYNSFSVYLLAKASIATKQAKYLEAARLKAHVGMYPGQLSDGPRRGRWADPHNARPAYHFILIRAAATLLAALPVGDADAAPTIQCLKLAIEARVPEISKAGLAAPDSQIEALVAIDALPAASREKLQPQDVQAALSAIESFGVDCLRSRKAVLGPGPWGLILRRGSQAK